MRIDHLKHNFVESRMLSRKLKEIQIEWDEKIRKQREHKEKSKLNIVDKTKRHTQHQSGKFEPYEETKELSKINKWLDRHNESALKEKVESKRLEAIRNRKKMLLGKKFVANRHMIDIERKGRIKLDKGAGLIIHRSIYSQTLFIIKIFIMPTIFLLTTLN